MKEWVLIGMFLTWNQAGDNVMYHMRAVPPKTKAECLEYKKEKEYEYERFSSGKYSVDYAWHRLECVRVAPKGSKERA